MNSSWSKSKIETPLLGIASTLQPIFRVPFHFNSSQSFLLDTGGFSLTHTYLFWSFTFNICTFAKVTISVLSTLFPVLLSYKTSFIIKHCVKCHLFLSGPLSAFPSQEVGLPSPSKCSHRSQSLTFPVMSLTWQWAFYGHCGMSNIQQRMFPKVVNISLIK